MPFLTRRDLQAIAQAKLDDSTLLLLNNRWSNAYYLAGYAVELGLKSCIARQITAEAIPDKAFISAIYTHNLRQLVNVAGLNIELQAREKADNEFAVNWALVLQWSPEKRYEATDPYSAQSLVEAITNQKTGVFPWIRTHW